MFYKIELKDHIRVPPDMFGLDVKEAVTKRIKMKFDGFISQDLGIVIDVSNVKEVGEGVIIPGDGASYYKTDFELLTFKPELQEVVTGRIKDIVDFITIRFSEAFNEEVSFDLTSLLEGVAASKLTSDIIFVLDNKGSSFFSIIFRSIEIT